MPDIDIVLMAGTAPTFYKKIPVTKDLVHMSRLAPTLLTPSVSHSVYHQFLDLVVCIVAREYNL